jgi:predicted outer membrane repeat protein
MIELKNASSRLAARVVASLAAVLFAGSLLAVPAFAGGQVGDGTPGSCYEAALDAKLAGGGLVTFNCGPAPHTILVTTYKMIGDDTEIRGGGVITISGGNTTSLFQVFAGRTFILRDLGLTRGSGTFGAIQNFGQLHISSGRLIANSASASGGAVENYGSLHITNTVIAENQAGGLGGAIYNDIGTLTLHTSQVYSNTAEGGGGAIYNGPGSQATVSGSQMAGNDSFPGLDGGGALLNRGTATLTNSTLRANRAVHGGGIYSTGALTLTGTVFQDNQVIYPGPNNGAGLAVYGGTAVASNVQFVGNVAYSGSYGGGVYNRGQLAITGAIFTRNQATTGGAIMNGGAMTLTSALVYTNTAGGTGGVANGADGSINSHLRLVNVTVSDNSGSFVASGVRSDNGVATLIHATVANNRGGGVGQVGSGQIRLQNSVVADNSPANCSGTVTSDGHNLSSDASCGGWSKPGDQTDKPAQLGPLAGNGGPTLTHLPQPGSPLIDGAQCLPEVPTDQRGVARPFGAACDIGAVEWMRLFAFLPVVRR